MPLIGRHNVKNSDIPGWPNPFHLKESELTQQINDIPLEIVTLAMIKMISQLPYLKDPLSRLRTNGVGGSFSWDHTKDGNKFWDSIRRKDLDIFYQVYTPSKLLERVKDIKKIRYKWERKITI